jgi:hypothetical protein
MNVSLPSQSAICKSWELSSFSSGQIGCMQMELRPTRLDPTLDPACGLQLNASCEDRSAASYSLFR